MQFLQFSRSARVVLDHHGQDALIHAAKRADDMLERGDVQGYEMWLAILAVLEAARAHPSGAKLMQQQVAFWRDPAARSAAVQPVAET